MSKKDKLRNQHLNLYSFQIQIAKQQCKNTTNNIQDNMSVLEPSFHKTPNSEYCRLAKAQENGITTKFMNMIESLKEAMNKFLNKIEEESKTC